MIALALSPVLLAPILLAPVLATGDFIESQVTIRMVSAAEEIDITEIETWRFEVVKAGAEGIQTTLTRRLIETRMNGTYAPGPSGPGLVDAFSLTPEGRLGFRPFARTALEGRLWRVLLGPLPSSQGGVFARETVESEANPKDNLPAGVFGRVPGKRKDGLAAADVTYRELDSVRALGKISVDEASGWPLYWDLRISGLRLEGGETLVDTLVTMVATAAKLRGKSFALTVK